MSIYRDIGEGYTFGYISAETAVKSCKGQAFRHRFTLQPRASMRWESIHEWIPFGVSEEAPLTAFVTIESIIVALVVADLLVGNVGMAGIQPSTRTMILNLWDFWAFLANSMVFLLIGLSIELTLLWENLDALAVAVVAVVGSRAIVVYGFSWLPSLWRRQAYLTPSWRHVLLWGGLRGAISLALS